MDILSLALAKSYTDESGGGGGATPDWNAAEGASGYIKNKPFEIVLEERDGIQIVGASSAERSVTYNNSIITTTPLIVDNTYTIMINNTTYTTKAYVPSAWKTLTPNIVCLQLSSPNLIIMCVPSAMKAALQILEGITWNVKWSEDEYCLIARTYDSSSTIVDEYCTIQELDTTHSLVPHFLDSTFINLDYYDLQNFPLYGYNEDGSNATYMLYPENGNLNIVNRTDGTTWTIAGSSE